MLFKARRQVSARTILLGFVDLSLIVVCFYFSSVIRFGQEMGHSFILEHIPTLSVVVMVFLTVFYASGVYDPQIIYNKNHTLVAALVAVAIATALIILLFYAKMHNHLGRGVLAAMMFSVFLSVLFTRSVYRHLIWQGYFKKRTLIIGDGEDATQILSLLQDKPNSPYEVFGVVTSQGKIPVKFIQGMPVLGHFRELKEFIDVYQIECLVVCTSLSKEYDLLRELRPIRYKGIELLDYTALYEELALSIPLDHINDEWLMHAASSSSRIHIRKLKRLMDIIIASIGLVLSIPFSLFAIIGIKLSSPGPIFFVQERVGRGGELFSVIKFRTMCVDAESKSGAVWSGKNDSRVTGIGKLLRASRIDEIPQLVNVFNGHMSLIGPRPERPEFVDMLSEVIPFYKERLLVSPGITGWAQVKYPYASSIEASRKKLEFDLYYIKHMGVLLDIAILLKTFKTIIVGLKHSGDFQQHDVGQEERMNLVDGAFEKKRK